MRTPTCRQFILSLVAVVGFVSALQAAPPAKPNIVFILVDDQCHDTLGCAGRPVLKTPPIPCASGPIFPGLSMDGLSQCFDMTVPSDCPQ